MEIKCLKTRCHDSKRLQKEKKKQRSSMDEGNVIHKMTCCNCQDSLELKHQNADKYEEKPKILDIFNAEKEIWRRF